MERESMETNKTEIAAKDKAYREAHKTEKAAKAKARYAQQHEKQNK